MKRASLPLGQEGSQIAQYFIAPIRIALPPPSSPKKVPFPHPMDPSIVLEGTGECSSIESGWTTYIASPDHGDDDDGDDEDSNIGSRQKGYRKNTKDIDSDDSMASDASSGPTDQYGSRLSGHARNHDERKHVSKKYNLQQEEKKRQQEQIRADKNKAGSRTNSGGRSKKA